MREIKFRAWDKKAKRLIMNVGIQPYHHFSTWSETNETTWVRPDNKDFPLMQYTGIKDENGVEIYEGDIVEAFEKNYEVKFKQTESKLYVDYGFPNKHNGPAPHWCEVVGNIYENAELLRKEA